MHQESLNMITTECNLRKLIRNILYESDKIFSDTYQEVVADHNNTRPENDISNIENNNTQKKYKQGV